MLQLCVPGGEVGFLGDAAIPADIYFVARHPVPLVGMGFPARIDWQLLSDQGVHHVVCLTHDHDVPYDSAPIQCHMIGLQDLFCEPHGPRDPVAELVKVKRAALITSQALAHGEGVAVHCRGGRGRAGTVIGLALTQLGHRPRDVVDYLDRLHKARGKGGWPESPWRKEHRQLPASRTVFASCFLGGWECVRQVAAKNARDDSANRTAAAPLPKSPRVVRGQEHVARGMGFWDWGTKLNSRYCCANVCIANHRFGKGMN